MAAFECPLCAKSGHSNCGLNYHRTRRQRAANGDDDERGHRISNGIRREPGPVIAASLHQHADEDRP